MGRSFGTIAVWSVAGALGLAALGLRRLAAQREREAETDPARATARARRLYDRGAARYDTAIAVLDRLVFDEGRRWVCRQARGRVLEIAAGTGRNLPHYPPGVHLMATDLSPRMIAMARRRAAVLGRAVALQVGDAQSLPFRDRSVDTVVCTLGLCTIPDDRRAIHEASRVLRAGGRLLLLEHVRSDRPGVRLVQRLLHPVFCALAGDHLLRDPVPIVQGLGFRLERVERSGLGIVQRLAARKPGALEGRVPGPP